MTHLPARVAVENRYVTNDQNRGWIGTLANGTKCFLHADSPLSPGPSRGSDNTVVWETKGTINVGGEIFVNVRHWQLYSSYETLLGDSLPAVIQQEVGQLAAST